MAQQNENRFPWTIQEIEPEVVEELQNLGSGRNPFVRVGPKGYVMFHEYKQFASTIFNMPLRADDIFILGCPRSGTTMTQELVWLLANDLNFKKAKSVHLQRRCPFMEYSLIQNSEQKQQTLKRVNQRHDEEYLGILEWFMQPVDKSMAGLPSPRSVKSHIPLSLLPPKLLDTAKAIYIARDPRAVAVSQWHFMKDYFMEDFGADFKTWWNFFTKSTILFTPYFEHVKEAWEKRNHPHMLFLFYEELSKDLPATIRRTAGFLGKELSEGQLADLCEHLSFENMKINTFINRDPGNILFGNELELVRKGKVGGWRDYFDAELAEQAERWIADNLRDTDLRFPQMN